MAKILEGHVLPRFWYSMRLNTGDHQGDESLAIKNIVEGRIVFEIVVERRELFDGEASVSNLAWNLKILDIEGRSFRELDSLDLVK